MSNLRKSIHAQEHEHLRKILINRRQELGLTQRMLADRLGVIYSLVGKVEIGDRRLDVIEFITYCKALELSPIEILASIDNSHKFDE